MKQQRPYERIPDDPHLYQHRLRAMQAVVDRIDTQQGQPRRIVRGEPGMIAMIEQDATP
jgi:hypothetical protein